MNPKSDSWHPFKDILGSGLEKKFYGVSYRVHKIAYGDFAGLFFVRNLEVPSGIKYGTLEACKEACEIHAHGSDFSKHTQFRCPVDGSWGYFRYEHPLWIAKHHTDERLWSVGYKTKRKLIEALRKLKIETK